MSSSNYRVRRATLDDIGQLTALWQSMQFPTDDLARRVTEFQVAEGAGGLVLGAVGLQIAERQGLVHSEAFSDFALEVEGVRPEISPNEDYATSSTMKGSNGMSCFQRRQLTAARVRNASA